MSDIVERLREWSLCNMYPEEACSDLGTAMFEIARLRAEVERLRAVIERVYQSSAQKHIIELTRAALGDTHE